MAHPTPRADAPEMLSDEAEPDQRRNEAAAQLYLCPAYSACRYVRPVLQTCAKRTQLALFRDRRQPLAARHRARCADEGAAGDRGVRAQNGEGSGVVAPNPSFGLLRRVFF